MCILKTRSIFGKKIGDKENKICQMNCKWPAEKDTLENLGVIVYSYLMPVWTIVKTIASGVVDNLIHY